MGLGDVDRIGLAEARKKAAEASSLIVDGKDPINERKARKAALAVEQAKALSIQGMRRSVHHNAGTRDGKIPRALISGAHRSRPTLIRRSAISRWRKSTKR